MRICLVLETGGGGAGRHVLDLAREFASRDHHVVVIYSSLRAEASFLAELSTLPITAVEVPMRRELGTHELASLRALGEAIARHGPFDIVHGHSSKAGALVRLAAVGKAKRVYTPHAFRGLDHEAGLLVRSTYNLAEFALGLFRTDALIAVSTEELAFAKRFTIAPGRRHLIRNGVIHPVSLDRNAVRKSLGIADDRFVVGFVGRLSYQKAPERFVEVVSRVVKQRPQVCAVMLGDGDRSARIERAIAEAGCGEAIKWLKGAAGQDYIGAFDVLMMTSRYEGLSYVMLESLAGHVPVISTDVAGARDAIGGAGITVQGEDVVGALTRALLSLIDDDTERARLVAAAAERSAMLNGPRMIDETEVLYRKLLGA